MTIMDEPVDDHDRNPQFWAPGTVTLEDCKDRLLRVSTSANVR